MKGVILAGGNGTRLYPNTKVTNKHLLPVYNKPMIYYPIENMIKAGIKDILILPGKDHAGDFAKLLGSGSEFNVNFTFKIQDHAGGLAYAVGLAEDFVGDDNFMVIFGDNIIDHDFYDAVNGFQSGAQIFCKEVDDPKRFGVAVLEGDTVAAIEEKPENPKSNWAVIGAYLYDAKAFEYIKTLEPSARGELEITDLNNLYIKDGTMRADFMKSHWYDTGTHASLAQAAYHLMNQERPADVYKYKLDEKVAPTVAVGTILYNSKKYLPDFLQSLQKQDYANIRLYVIDNNSEPDQEEIAVVKKYFPQATIIREEKNTGFARGNNLMIRAALKDGCDFFMATNNDMLLEENVVSELLNALLKSPRHAAATGKVKRWNFAQKDGYDNGKTNYFDTTGINITKEHRFMDRGQGEIDHGQYDQEEEIFGSSGAIALYRMTALEDTAFVNENGEKEYYDELMFMYKEDVDLAYRLQWGGYSALYTPKAVMYHDRTLHAKGKGIIGIIRGRLGRKKHYKEWSWLHHHIILKKMVDSSYSSDVRMKTWWYEFKSFVYILFAEPFLLKQFWQLHKMRHQIQARKEQLRKRANVRNRIEKMMQA